MQDIPINKAVKYHHGESLNLRSLVYGTLILVSVELQMTLDYSGQNLRGRNFKGQNLEGANFSYADIQGANFSEANLRGANFSHAQGGLQRSWAIFLVLVSLILSGMSGFLWTYNGYLVSLILDCYSIRQIAGWTSLIIFVTFLLITIRQGLLIGVLFLAVTGAAAWAGIFAQSITGEPFFTIAGTLAGALAGIFTGALAGIFTGAFASVLALTGALVITVAGIFTGVVVWVKVYTKKGALELAFAVAGPLFSTYIGWRAMKGDEKYSLIKNIAIAFAAIGGTSFSCADLTNVNFTQAKLKSTDFRNAILTGTCWHQTKMLDRVRPGSSYLQKPQIRQLLITGQGQDKNFDGQNLRGINLQKANLADTSFIGADLSEANLQDADLSRAKLKQTQLDNTDFTGATLTGAYIEDWGITRETKLHGVRCEYIFMRVPTKDDPDPHRKPDNKNEVFKDGDFADFIQPIIDTLDLYHNQEVDPRAVAIAFKKLAENNPEAELEIVAMEKRGYDKFLLKAKTAAGSDKSQLSVEYFDEYNQIKALDQSQQLLLVEKDSRIRSLENMLTTAMQQPKFYLQGDNKVSENSGINIQNSSNVSGVAGGGSVANLGTISGNVSIAINELPDSKNADKPGIKELLTQLQEAISQSSELSAEDKAEALEQVQTLAAAAKSPEAANQKKTAKTAITMLKGLFTGLPTVANLVEAANKLLPEIAKLFGLG